MELKIYLEMFKKYSKTFVIVVAAVFILTVAVSYIWPRGYQALIPLKVVTKGETQEQYGGYYSIQADELFIDSFIDWLKTPQIAKTIFETAGEEIEEEDLTKLEKKIGAKKASSNTMQIKYKDKKQEKLEKLVQATFVTIKQKNKELEASEANLIRTMESSSAPLFIPVKTDYILVAIIGLVLGIILGILAIFTFQYFNPLLLSPALTLKILGKDTDYVVLPKRLRANIDLGAKDLEKIRIFRSKLISEESIKSKSFLFFGADTEKSFQSAFILAKNLAKSGRETLLVEADFKNPKLAKSQNQNLRSGWEKFLTNTGKISSFIKQSGDKNLFLLPVKNQFADSSDLISQRGAEKIIKLLQNQKKFLVVFGPQYNLYSDSLLFLDATDTIILVIELGKTREEVILELAKIFKQKNIKPKLVFLE